MKKISLFCVVLVSILSTACGSGGGVVPPVTTCTSTQRQFTVTNSTNETIWVGITAGTISCLTDADCPTDVPGSCVGETPTAAGTCGCAGGASQCGTISTCNSSDNYCYWNLPTLLPSQINLASGASSTICFPAPATGMDIQWSGNIFARTGCDSTGQNCETGDCGATSSGICPTGTGGNPPASLFEFTLSNQTSFQTTPNFDYYDVSIINGINVAVSGGPVAGTYSAVSGNAYSCTTPGSTSAQGSLTACSWTVEPVVATVNRSTILRDVYPTTYSGTGSCPNGGSPNTLGYCECTADTDCASSQFCGFAMNASASKYTNVCGTHIGWWTADQLCASTIAGTPLGAPLNCASTVTNSDASTSTYTNFYACTEPAGASNPEQAQSCYSNGAVVDCCGCATSTDSPYFDKWPTVLNPDFAGCYNNNPTWGTISQPWLVFLKTACPTAYTYPFDDATSTFTCRGSATVGAPKYTVTFMNTN